MAILQKQNAFVSATAVSIGLARMFTVTAASGNPTYLVLSALDRNEYTAGASTATGSLSGSGHTLAMIGLGGDARGAGIVFSYQASTGRYYNSIYGYLDQLIYNSSGSASDVTNLSLFGTNNLSQANAYAGNVYSMMQVDAAGYVGSATIVTQSRFVTAVPAQATPASIAAIANSFVGQVWNMNGCWVLASTIAAEAGASLPVQSTLIDLPGRANGEWIIAFNGPAGQTGNWQSMVTTGEMIVIGTLGGGGHITTCVSGTGTTAMLVDNITYINSAGQVQNAANDGSRNDIIIAAPHAASGEWAGVLASSVVIYELDAPIVTCKVVTCSISFGSSQALDTLFAATDPANKAITQWQVYDTAADDMLVLNGVTSQDHSTSTALTTSSLSSVSLLAGSVQVIDMIEVRAFNGSYWGDWTGLAVSVVPSTAPVPLPPILSLQTASQTWLGGKAVSLTLPTGTFTDPQGQKLTYAVSLSTGGALPSWLTFNAATCTFSGTAPTTVQKLGIVVTATDSSGLSARETFTASVLGTPVLTAVTANQTWTAGSKISLALSPRTFVDPQGQGLAYKATLSNGSVLPSWLLFNATTETFTGFAPQTAQTLGITVTATDTSGLASSETFTVNVQAAPAPPNARGGIAVTQTPNQTWANGQTGNLVLPSNTFTDLLGLKMTFAAYQVSGPSITSWMHFNPANLNFYGTVPATLTGSAQIAVVATDSKNLTATDLFKVTFGPATGHATASLSDTSGTMGFTIAATNGVVAIQS